MWSSRVFLLDQSLSWRNVPLNCVWIIDFAHHAIEFLTLLVLLGRWPGDGGCLASFNHDAIEFSLEAGQVTWKLVCTLVASQSPQMGNSLHTRIKLSRLIMLVGIDFCIDVRRVSDDLRCGLEISLRLLFGRLAGRSQSYTRLLRGGLTNSCHWPLINLLIEIHFRMHIVQVEVLRILLSWASARLWSTLHDVGRNAALSCERRISLGRRIHSFYDLFNNSRLLFLR